MICSWEEFAFLAIPILLAYPKTLQLQNLRVGFPIGRRRFDESPRLRVGLPSRQQVLTGQNVLLNRV